MMKSAIVLAGALALVCVSLIPAHAQSAIEFAATGMGQRISVAPQVSRRFARRVLRAETRAGMLSGVSPALAAKAREISAVCGSVVISGVRHTRVAGSRRMSLHASGRAVDMRGNPVCIYARLRGWPGGYSTDYGRVAHVHISLGGREDGIRFTHHHVNRRTRLAWR